MGKIVPIVIYGGIGVLAALKLMALAQQPNAISFANLESIAFILAAMILIFKEYGKIDIVDKISII